MRTRDNLKRLLLITFLVVLPAKATTRYIAQTPGTYSGGTACNGQTAITPATWNGTSESPGDISYVCGTITGTAGTTILTFPSSGTAANPLVLYFDTGAVLQESYCATGTGGSNSGCIATGGHSYIIIDGQNTGTIQATLNGSPGGACPGGTCTTQNGGDGIWIDGSNITVRNLTIANLYVHTVGGTDNFPASTPTGIEVNNGGSNILIQNNTMSEMYVAADLTTGTNNSNFQAAGNTIHQICWGFSVQQKNNGTNYTDVYFYNNHVYDHSYANGTASCHSNAIHIFQSNACSSCNITGLYFYNNELDGPVSSADTTSQVYTDQNGGNATIINGYYFNNVMSFADGDCASTCDALFAHANGSPSYTYNNTFIGNATSTTQQSSCFQVYVLTQIVFENNFATNCQMDAQSKGSTWGTTSYNYYANGGFGYGGSSNAGCCTSSFAAWQSDIGGDANSVNPSSDPLPLCNSSTDCSNVKPASGSPLIGFGTNLYSICNGQPNPGLGALCYDKAGSARPTTGNWDAGAYQSGSSASGSSPNPPTGLTATIQ